MCIEREIKVKIFGAQYSDSGNIVFTVSRIFKKDVIQVKLTDYDVADTVLINYKGKQILLMAARQVLFDTTTAYISHMNDADLMMYVFGCARDSASTNLSDYKIFNKQRNRIEPKVECLFLFNRYYNYPSQMDMISYDEFLETFNMDSSVKETFITQKNNTFLQKRG